jgi:uncharacterized protein (TIGR03437 family)
MSNTTTLRNITTRRKSWVSAFALAGIFGALSQLASAATYCDPSGVCRVYISKKLVNPIAQETPVWCWAASLSMLFDYYGHPVDQAEIVTRYFGAPVAVSGPPWVLRDALNTTWVDDNRASFMISSRITDYYSGSSFQVSNADIISAIGAENPVFYGDNIHAMILVQVDYVSLYGTPQILAAWAIDPYPATGFGFRQLRPDELQGYFAAIATVKNVAAPQISRITDMGGQNNRLASGSWMSVFGTTLSVTTRTWRAGDFAGTNLPTNLDHVQVFVNGKPAYVSYISPTQINFLAPADAAVGSVSIQVVNDSGRSNLFGVSKQTVAPVFFIHPEQGNRYVVATGDGALLGPRGMLGASVTTRPAKPGETVSFWMSGLGPTNPSFPDGHTFNGSARLTNPVSCLIGGVPASVDWAGIVGPGLYQVNVRVPNLPNGDAKAEISLAGYTTPAGAYLSISN